MLTLKIKYHLKDNIIEKLVIYIDNFDMYIKQYKLVLPKKIKSLVMILNNYNSCNDNKFDFLNSFIFPEIINDLKVISQNMCYNKNIICDLKKRGIIIDNYFI